MNSFLVIGLGQFGRYLAVKLVELGNEVMAVDQDETRVEQLAGIATATCVGDCSNENVLKALAVDSYEVCFVCISDDFQSSLEVTAGLKELGAKYVVARADREKQIKFLKKIGADHVIHTEMDMANRAATSYSSRKVFDYFELTPKYAIIEIVTPEIWIGKTVAEVNVRNRYNVNILGVKIGDEIEPVLSPAYRFTKGTHLLVAGEKDSGLRLMKQI